MTNTPNTTKRELSHLSISGLISRRFYGIDDVYEVICTGHELPPGTDLLTLVLHTKKDDRVLAYFNMAKRECSTSENFVACEIDAEDSKRSRLKALIVDLKVGESRAFGCNVSAFGSGGRLQVLSWTLVLHNPSE